MTAPWLFRIQGMALVFAAAAANIAPDSKIGTAWTCVIAALIVVAAAIVGHHAHKDTRREVEAERQAERFLAESEFGAAAARALDNESRVRLMGAYFEARSERARERAA